ncbi:MAG: serine hydrolase [bacterium]|nr:serine hydrolase [bacterium]
MVVAVTIILIIILSIFQINPITFAMDTFNISKTQAQVMGEVEVFEQADAAVTLAQEEIAADKNVLPQIEEKVLTISLRPGFDPMPEITAQSAIVIDADTSEVLFGKNISDITSIASITKLMTALVVLDQEIDLNQEYTITADDRREGGRIYLFNGDIVTLDNLINASLVGSGNTETIAMVHAIGYEEQQFVDKMNDKAFELGLKHTVFVDPIGLSSNNLSNSSDVAALLNIALSNEKIRGTTAKSSYRLVTKQGKTRIIENTDMLLGSNEYEVLGGKTGYINSAGFCFAGKFQNENGNRIISVVLNSAGVELRFEDTKKLVDWTYNNYLWPKL